MNETTFHISAKTYEFLCNISLLLRLLLNTYKHKIYNSVLDFWLLFCCCDIFRTFKNLCFILQCPTHSWYLMVDMQLYTISPFILLFLLTWNNKRCLVTLCVLASMGLIVSFLVNYLLELPAGFMSGE